MAIVSKITRHISLATRHREIIDYTAGTNLLPIEFIIDDYTIPANATAAIYAKKQSGEIVFNACEINHNLNSIVVTPTIQMFIEGGMIPTQLQILSGGKMLNSFLMTFNVETKVVSDEAIESTNEFTAFSSILQSAQTLTENVVSDYVAQHGITSGANATQAAQIQTNKEVSEQASTDIRALTETVAFLAETVNTLSTTVASMAERVDALIDTIHDDHDQLQDLQADMNDFNEGIDAFNLEDMY